MKDEKEYPIHKYVIYIISLISISYLILRILLYYFDILPWIKETKDIDFKILIEGMDNGLINFYDDVAISKWPPYYLYFWYFLFFPVYIIPIDGLIGVYVWDALRLILTIVVVNKSAKVFKQKKNLLIFYIFSIVGYSIDAYYNNVNFLIVFFLFYSFIYIGKDKMWIAGILFTLSTFKITAILFLPILLLSKKIKVRDLIYFIIPFVLICIPYIIFPDYLFQMTSNWLYSDTEVQGLLIIESIFWKALQPSHLMFIALLVIIYLESINIEKKRNVYRLILVSVITIYYVYLTVIVFFIPAL